jgi:hypothetical protein
LIRRGKPFPKEKSFGILPIDNKKFIILVHRIMQLVQPYVFMETIGSLKNFKNPKLGVLGFSSFSKTQNRRLYQNQITAQHGYRLSDC